MTKGDSRWRWFSSYTQTAITVVGWSAEKQAVFMRLQQTQARLMRRMMIGASAFASALLTFAVMAWVLWSPMLAVGMLAGAVMAAGLACAAAVWLVKDLALLARVEELQQRREKLQE